MDLHSFRKGNGEQKKKKKNLLWRIAGLFICLVLFTPKEKKRMIFKKIIKN